MQPQHWINNESRIKLVCYGWHFKGLLVSAYRVSSSGTSWQYHLAVYHKTTRLCIALSAHGSTRAKCIRSNGRNTNTSILIATDMHTTETLNQQWDQTATSNLFLCYTKTWPSQSMALEILAVDHKTTRLCSLVSSWIDTGEMHKIQWKNTNKIQHKRCKNWTEYN